MIYFRGTSARARARAQGVIVHFRRCVRGARNRPMRHGCSCPNYAAPIIEIPLLPRGTGTRDPQRPDGRLSLSGIHGRAFREGPLERLTFPRREWMDGHVKVSRYR